MVDSLQEFLGWGHHSNHVNKYHSGHLVCDQYTSIEYKKSKAHLLLLTLCMQGNFKDFFFFVDCRYFFQN